MNPKVGSWKIKINKTHKFLGRLFKSQREKNKLPMSGEKEWPSLQILLILKSKQGDTKSNFRSVNSTAKMK